MTPEQPINPTLADARETFGFKDDEMYYRLSDERFRAILEDEKTLVHSISESENNYGGFLFITVSRPHQENRLAVTFYGLGFHEHQERWLTDEWFWYPNYPSSQRTQETIPKEEVQHRIDTRLKIISARIDK